MTPRVVIPAPTFRDVSGHARSASLDRLCDMTTKACTEVLRSAHLGQDPLQRNGARPSCGRSSHQWKCTYPLDDHPQQVTTLLVPQAIPEATKTLLIARLGPSGNRRGQCPWTTTPASASLRAFESSIGVRGFEPSTFSSRTKRATKLRSTPDRASAPLVFAPPGRRKIPHAHDEALRIVGSAAPDHD